MYEKTIDSTEQIVNKIVYARKGVTLSAKADKIATVISYIIKRNNISGFGFWQDEQNMIISDKNLYQKYPSIQMINHQPKSRNRYFYQQIGMGRNKLFIYPTVILGRYYGKYFAIGEEGLFSKATLFNDMERMSMIIVFGFKSLK